MPNAAAAGDDDAAADAGPPVICDDDEAAEALIFCAFCCCSCVGVVILGRLISVIETEGICSMPVGNLRFRVVAAVNVGALFELTLMEREMCCN